MRQIQNYGRRFPTQSLQPERRVRSGGPTAQPPPLGGSMTGRRSVETPIEDTFTKYLTDKGKGDAGEEGAYRTDAERELQRFQRWCLGETADPANASPPESWAGVVDGDTVRFADLDTTVFSDYARHLSTAGYAAGTVLTYYAHVASWCGWAHAQGYIPRHYARESDAEDPLPENDGRRPGDQQAWEPIHRDLITQFVDRRVSEAFDALGAIEVPHVDRGDPESETWRAKQRARFEAYQRCREQALVYVIAYTGLRGSEFLSAPKEDREDATGFAGATCRSRTAVSRYFGRVASGRRRLSRSPSLRHYVGTPRCWTCRSRGRCSRRSTGPRSLRTSLRGSPMPVSTMSRSNGIEVVRPT